MWLRRDQHGKVRARLMTCGPWAGRSDTSYADWLKASKEAFRYGIGVAALDPFHGLQDRPRRPARGAVRRRVQQDTTDHRAVAGRRPVPGRPHHARRRAGEPYERQRVRLDAAIAAHEAHDEVHIAWQCAKQLRAIYHATSPSKGRQVSETVVASFPGCLVPEIARLGRTLKQWRTQLLAYFDTGGVSNGNGLLELHGLVARGFRNRGNLPAADAPDRWRLSHPHVK